MVFVSFEQATAQMAAKIMSIFFMDVLLFVHTLGTQAFRDLGIVRDHLGQDPVVVRQMMYFLIIIWF